MLQTTRLAARALTTGEIIHLRRRVRISGPAIALIGHDEFVHGEVVCANQPGGDGLRRGDARRHLNDPGVGPIAVWTRVTDRVSTSERGRRRPVAPANPRRSKDHDF